MVLFQFTILRKKAMGLLNSFFWLMYGLALMDMVIFLPNFCGFILSIVQVVLCIVFSKKSEMLEETVDRSSLSFDELHASVGEEDDRNMELL